MNKSLFKVFSVITILALMLMAVPMQSAQAAAGSLVGSYTQNFNTLATSGTSNVWSDDSTLPSWYSNRTVYLAGTGSSNTGGLYSFGSSTALTDRALGSVASGGTNTIFYGVRFVNDTGGIVTQINVSYTGEQWRTGGSAACSPTPCTTPPSVAQKIDFQYQVGATNITGGTWIDVDALDFTSPIFGTTAPSALDGNATANRLALASSITGLSILPNQEIWLRWQDVNDPNNDHGLAVDNLAVTAVSNPIDPAPFVSSTSPAGSATNVLLTDNITVTFSEPVNVSGNWFQLVCPTSGTRNVADTTVTGGPTSFTIDPNDYSGANFANSETCTLTIFATQVTDVDTNDPDDAMASNYVTSFTTIGPDNAPEVASTVPANGATNVPLNQNVIVNFTEPVNVTDPWFSLTCAASGAHAATVTGGPTSFTLNPSVDFVYGELCTLVIDASKIADQDSNDPPNNMVINFVAGFATELDPCTQPFTPIYQIQGSGPIVALTGTLTTQGVVVGDYEGASPALRGFFIQDVAGDGDPATSDGMFVFEGSNANTVSLGDIVRVTGTAGENQGQSQISVGTIRKCGTGSVAPVDVTFPVSSSTFLEQYEGMLVRLPQTMYVTEHFQLGRFGQVVLSSGGKLKQPTNVVAPGAPALALQAQNDLNKIILDDASQAQNPDPILFGRNGDPLSASNTLRGGDTATNIVGVMTYTWAGNAASGNAYRVRPINALGGSVNFVEANSRPASVPVVGGNVKVVGMNLLNFFNSFSSCFPSGTASDCRGANNATEFTRQYQKTVAAILAMNPDVIGVNELENDGYGPTSALQFLVDQLNAATAPGTYAFINVDANAGQTNAMGGDAIRVALLYKPAVVTPIGQTAPLNSTAFVNGGDSAPRNRVSLAQAFQLNSNGAVFIVNINHLKSKGSACDAPDAGDGQGNCNQVRVNAVTTLMNWLATNPTGTGDPDILMIGDYNSYAKEDPITVIQNAGFTNLIESFLGPDAYSYVFDGQWGYLDHALGSASLVGQVAGVADYHINSDEPSVLDYNTEFKSAGQVISLYAPDQFRVSDHDSVIVGLQLNAPPTVDAGGPYNASEGGSVLVSATGSDPDNDALTYEWDLDNNGSFETPGQSVPFNVGLLDGPNTYTIKVKVTDTGDLFAVDTATVNVANIAPTATFGTPGSVNEGSSFGIMLTGEFDPSSADTSANFTYAFDCGSGYGAFGSSNTATCNAADNPGVTVKGQIKDKDGGVTEYSALVTINNVAPTATFNAPVSVNEGSSIALSLTSPMDVSADLSSLQYAFDCGTGYGVFGSSNTATCTAVDNPDVTVKGKIQDKDGGVTEYSALVTINNVAPMATFNAPASVNEGSSIALSLTSPVDVPADLGSLQYAFDCGSGYGAFGSSNTATCNAVDNPNVTVKGKIQDKDGGVTEYSALVTINNVAPTATFNAPVSVNEGSSIALSLTSPVDVPADLGSLQYAFDCGSGYGAFSPSNTASCSTSDNSTRSVRGKVMDKDGGVTEYSALVTINNVAPVVTASFASSSLSCGASNATLNVSFSDPGADTYTAVINWGDGNTQTVNGATSPFSLAHTYAMVGIYNATITVTDDDGGVGTASASTTVNFNSSGFLQPINADGTSVFKYNSTIPVKIRFTNCDGSIPTNLAPTIKLTLMNGATPVLDINEPISTSAADTTGVMRFSTNQYIYNLATKSLPDSSATYRITVTIPGNGTYTVQFGLRP